MIEMIKLPQKSADILNTVRVQLESMLEKEQLTLEDSYNFSKAINNLYNHLSELSKETVNLSNINSIYWHLKLLWEQAATPKQFFRLFDKQRLIKYYGSINFLNAENNYIIAKQYIVSYGLPSLVFEEKSKYGLDDQKENFNDFKNDLKKLEDSFAQANETKQQDIKNELKSYLNIYRLNIIANPLHNLVLIEKYAALWKTAHAIFDINPIFKFLYFNDNASFYRKECKKHEEFIRLIGLPEALEEAKIIADIEQAEAKFCLGENRARTLKILQEVNSSEKIEDLEKIYKCAIQYGDFEIVQAFLSNSSIVKNEDFYAYLMQAIGAIPAHANLKLPHFAEIFKIFTTELENKNLKIAHQLIHYCRTGTNKNILNIFIEYALSFHDENEKFQALCTFLNNRSAHITSLRLFLDDITLKFYPEDRIKSPLQIALLNNLPTAFILEFLKDSRFSIDEELIYKYIEGHISIPITATNIHKNVQFVTKLLAALVLRFAIEKERSGIPLPSNMSEIKKLIKQYENREHPGNIMFFSTFSIFESYEIPIIEYFQVLKACYSPEPYKNLALTVLATDEYLRVKTSAPEPVKRFFEIMKQLPLEMQIGMAQILCDRPVTSNLPPDPQFDKAISEMLLMN